MNIHKGVTHCDTIGDEFHIKFGQHLVEIKNELIQKLKNSRPNDITMIQPLIDAGIKPGVSKNLPEIGEPTTSVAIVKKPVLRVVS